MDLGNDVVILQNIFAPNASFRRQREKLIERNRPRACGPGNRNTSAQRHQHRRQVRWMNNIRWTTTENGVVLVLSFCSVTLRATLFQTHDFFQPEIPATWTLAEIAAHGAQVANLWRSDRV